MKLDSKKDIEKILKMAREKKADYFQRHNNKFIDSYLKATMETRRQ